MPSPPATVYLALFTGGVPDDTGSGATECSAGNYARLALTTGSSGSGTGSVFTESGGQLINAVDIEFPACSGADWGAVTGWALFNASTSGNMLVRGDVLPTISVTVGDTVKWTPGELVMIMS